MAAMQLRKQKYPRLRPGILENETATFVGCR